MSSWGCLQLGSLGKEAQSVHQMLKEKELALRGCLLLCFGKPCESNHCPSFWNAKAGIGGGGGRLERWGWGAFEGSPKAVNICPVKTHVPRIKDSRRDTKTLKERRDGVKT